jgi:hypothetical protein
MAPRLACAVILACIPLAKGLEPTQLLSIVTGLFLFIVIWETIGSLERCATLVESWKDSEIPEYETEGIKDVKEEPAAIEA